MKEKIRQSIGQRTKQEMIYKTKTRTIAEDKWERKKYLQECDGNTIQDVVLIKLHMQQVNCYYKRDSTDTKCPICKKSEETTEHMLKCEKANKFTLSEENNKGEQEQITKAVMQ